MTLNHSKSVTTHISSINRTVKYVSKLLWTSQCHVKDEIKTNNIKIVQS